MLTLDVRTRYCLLVAVVLVKQLILECRVIYPYNINSEILERVSSKINLGESPLLLTPTFESLIQNHVTRIESI